MGQSLASGFDCAFPAGRGQSFDGTKTERLDSLRYVGGAQDQPCQKQMAREKNQRPRFHHNQKTCTIYKSLKSQTQSPPFAAEICQHDVSQYEVVANRKNKIAKAHKDHE